MAEFRPRTTEDLCDLMCGNIIPREVRNMQKGRPTRWHSSRQEKHVAKAVGGKQVANSGATAFNKGDVTTDMFLIEAKTCTKPQATFTVRKEWFTKNKEEAFAMGKDYNAVVFDFGDGEQHYVIDEKLFKKLVEYLEAEG